MNTTGLNGKTLDGNVSNPKKKPLTYYRIILVGGVSICLIAAAVACLMYYLDTRDNDTVITTVAEPIVDPTLETIRPLGEVNLHGTFGSAQIDFSFNSNNGRGERYYTFRSDEIYSLVLKKAEFKGEGTYCVEIKELLKGRIEIGTYNGFISKDSFVGSYTSSHGISREVRLFSK